jgi:glycosyltransferase involved in cell wall biosynthesis
MKICHITSYIPKYHTIWAGAEIAFNSFVKILHKNHQDNIVLSTKPLKTAHEPHFTHDYTKTLSDYLPNIIASAITTLIPFDPVAYFHLKKKLKQIKPEVIHLHNFGAFTPSIVYAIHKLNIPIIFSAYDYWSICPVESLIDHKEENCKTCQNMKCWKCISKRKLGLIRIFLLPLRNKIFRGMLKKISQLNVLSETWSEPFKKAGINPQKIHVVPLTLSEDIIPPKTAPQTDSIIFIGWIEKRKGLERIIKAMPKVCQQYPNTKLHIIGIDNDKEYKQKLTEYIQENNLKDNILFLGKRPHNETLNYLENSFISVVPEQWEIAWPIALTEAMALEKPVVASNIGGIPGLVKDGETGFLANPKDSDSFADKIIFCLKNRETALKMGKKAREAILTICNEDNIFKSLMNSYSEANEN